MKIEVHHTCEDFDTYRAQRVKSMFNADSGCRFDLEADLPIDDADWSLGVIVGPSGSGKTSMGRHVLGPDAFYHHGADAWPDDQPIVEAILPDGEMDDVTAALAAVGLGDVPAWLRPYRVLSMGEQFRADLARIIAEKPERVVVDEFTSVVDRQIARFGALAFAKSWRRTGGKAVLLSCHYDILDWLEPDWVFDTATSAFRGRWLQPGDAEWFKRPRFELEVWETDWRYWPEFEPHHYLKLPRMVGAKCYVGTVEGQRVCHVAVGCQNRAGAAEARACRLVVLPEWQGAGVGLRFLDHVCELQMTGRGRMEGRRVTTLFHTTHPGLCAALRRNKRWRQVSCHLCGTNRSKESSRRSIVKSALRGRGLHVSAGYGGHFRAVQGFRYYGDRAQEAAR